MSKWILSVLLLGLVGCPGGEEAVTVDLKVTTQVITQGELIARLASPTPPLVLDVRTPAEYAEGHVPTAQNIPYDELPDRLSGIEVSKPNTVVVYCKSGRRAGIAEAALREAGFTKLLHLEGDMLGWQEAGRHIER